MAKRSSRTRSPRQLLCLLALLEPLAACTHVGSKFAGTVELPEPPPGETPAVLYAVGDIASCPDRDTTAAARAQGVANLVRSLAGDARAGPAGEPRALGVVALGDLAYFRGDRKDHGCFDAIWADLRDITAPVPGNHEYKASDLALPYHDYWGPRIAANIERISESPALADGSRFARGRYFYSFDLDTWHIIALDSALLVRSASGDRSARALAQEQLAWLEADLDRTAPGRCILAFWHHPRFSSGYNGGTPEVRRFVEPLYARGASVVLNAHDHHYERFLPQTPDGAADPESGFTAFVVGTGGRGDRGERAILAALMLMIRSYPIAGNSEVRLFDTYGALELRLYEREYHWVFYDLHRRPLDAGRRPCVERAPAAREADIAPSVRAGD